MCFYYRAAADYRVPIIEYHGLSRSYGALFFVKFHRYRSVSVRVKRRQLFLVAVSCHSRYSYRGIRLVKRYPVHVSSGEMFCVQLFFLSDVDSVVFDNLLVYVNVLSRSNAESAPLSYGVANNAAVSAYHVSVLVKKISLWIVLAGVLLHERNIIPVRYKADVLTVRLVRIYKTVFLRYAPRLRLSHLAEREEHMAEFLLRH